MKRVPSVLAIVASLLAAGSLAGGCASGLRPFPLKDVMWKDPDRRSFQKVPEEYYSPWAWDAADQTVFRPLSRFFAVDPGGESINVNALDEVPDSSWFLNRIGRRPMTPQEVAKGTCNTPPLDPKGPWTVIGAKPNGANPGFIIKDPRDDRRYLLKFDGVVQGPRATTADVVVSRMFHAAGYYVPCNQIIFFDRSILEISPKAKAEDESGEKVPMEPKHLDKVFSKGLRLADGRYRASSSLFLSGKPLGPFRYEGTRDDDPNDVVPHEDRRELRGSGVLNAWTNHFDCREQNTLTMWIEQPDQGGGYVQHNIIDFGDCFGSIWEPPMLGRRIGTSSYLDPGHVVTDFLTLGIITRPWDRARFGPSGKVFGYYDVEQFVPEDWKPGFPNPAVSRMTDRDGAWMARIISQFTDDHIRGAVSAGRLSNSELEQELIRVLIGRRNKILRHYLTQLSPLSWPEVRVAHGAARLCLRDLALEGGVFAPEQRRYSARAWLTQHVVVEPMPQPLLRGAQVCVALPAVPHAAANRPEYLIVDVLALSGSEGRLPARVHLYHLGGTDYRVVGMERPDGNDPPSRN